MSKRSSVLIWVLSFLVFTNLLAHFLPFERASIGNDDYALLMRANRLSISEVVSLVPRQPNRPLAFLLLMMQEKFIGDSPERGLWLVFGMTSLVLIAVFFFLEALFRDSYLALLGSVMFCLLPNILEIYHITTTAYTGVAHSLYLVSLTFMVYFVETEKRLSFAVSLSSYTLAIVVYETGFFLPIVFLGYSYLYRSRHLKTCLYYLIPASFYVVFRITRAFGFADPLAIHIQSPSLARLPANIVNVGVDLFHQYFGRYMARNLFYGVYQFFLIELPWPLVLLLLDVLFVLIALFWLRPRLLIQVAMNRLMLGVVMFVAFLIPVFGNQTGAVAGRTLVLPSVGLVVIALSSLQAAPQYCRFVLSMFLPVMLIVSQGNAWAQVVACRINGAVYETLKEKRGELSGADRVIIDTRSFADRIPFTWVQREFNVLNTYYGAQAFESWGLSNMVALITGPKPVYVATRSPAAHEDGSFKFVVSDDQGYRSVSRRVEVVPQEGTVIIDFKSVFGEQFNNGTRISKMVSH